MVVIMIIEMMIVMIGMMIVAIVMRDMMMLAIFILEMIIVAIVMRDMMTVAILMIKLMLGITLMDMEMMIWYDNEYNNCCNDGDDWRWWLWRTSFIDNLFCDRIISWMKFYTFQLEKQVTVLKEEIHRQHNELLQVRRIVYCTY